MPIRKHAEEAEDAQNLAAGVLAPRWAHLEDAAHRRESGSVSRLSNARQAQVTGATVKLNQRLVTGQRLRKLSRASDAEASPAQEDPGSGAMIVTWAFRA